MQKQWWACSAILCMAAACVAPDEQAVDNTASPGLVDNAATGETAQAASSFYPMGFARVTSTGSVLTAWTGSVWAPASFNSTGGAINVSHGSTGYYLVTFNELGASAINGNGGNVQLTAETTTNARCRVYNWYGSPNLAINVQCVTPTGALTDSGFSVLFQRQAMPAPSAYASQAAYAWVQANGVVDPAYAFNESGQPITNTPSATPGFYTINIPGASIVNASIMVSTYAQSGANVCSLSNWGPGYINVQCRDAANNLVNTAFSVSYAVTGPTWYQQSAHAWFNGAGASAPYSSALGKYGCSSAAISGALSPAPTFDMTVTGDFGPWSGAFTRASFSSAYGPGYCNIESLNTSSAPAPTLTTSTTRLRCYDPNGAVTPLPRASFTQITSDPNGPC